MNRLIIVPEGWPCKLSECKPGFLIYSKKLCFKWADKESGKLSSVQATNGEYLKVEDDCIVQPVVEKWEEVKGDS